jgi:serine/threonine protein kinase
MMVSVASITITDNHRAESVTANNTTATQKASIAPSSIHHPNMFPFVPALPSAFKEYKLEKLLGRGANGVVMQAINTITDVQVAIKFIPKQSIALNRLVSHPAFGYIPREVHIQSHLNHPSLTQLIDYYHDAEYYYIIQELVGSEWNKSESQDAPNPRDLFEFFEVNGNLTEAQGKKILKQLVSAMIYMKNRNIFHCDIKDENIAIDKDLNIKLIDFGAAEHMPASRYPDGTLLDFGGTPAFAAPETYWVQPYKPEASDAWSMGVMLFSLLCGHRPFSSYQEMLSKPLETPKHLSSECRSLLEQMLTTEPSKRISFEDIQNHKWLSL